MSTADDLVFELVLKNVFVFTINKCKGRSAPGRLARTLEIAAQAGMKMQMIRDIHRRLIHSPDKPELKIED